MLALQTAFGGPASALPQGAYWYTLLNLPKAWTLSQGQGVTVGVVDSGVQASLGDLRGQVLPGLDLSGTDSGAHSDTPLPGTAHFGHGTDMAVLIAGTGRGAGLVGVAPKAKILPVDSDTSSGNATATTIASGIRWAVDHGAKVVNVSLGAAGTCPSTLATALGYAYAHDVITVVASGDAAGAVYSPGNCPGAVTIGAVDATFRPWSTSAAGPDVSFVEPGVNLVNEDLDDRLNGPAAGNAGTSQAAAIASGTFALLRARFPSESARQIVTRALHHVHNGLGKAHLGERVDDALGYGMILPYNAMSEPTAPNAANPVYDRFAATLGHGGGGASASPSTPANTSADTTATSSGAAAPVPSSSHPVQSSGGSSSSLSPVLIGVIVLVVAGLIALVLGLRRRSRPPPPPGWH